MRRPEDVGVESEARQGLIPKDIPFTSGQPEHLYEIEETIDEGSFGKVCAGRRLGSKSDQHVAIKIIPYSKERSESVELKQELIKEINFLKDFDSPFVIKHYGTYFNTIKAEIWIVMELAEIGSLESFFIYCEHKFSEAELSALFARIILGLNYVHAKGLIHQDIKAKNVLMTLKGEVKLADFGVAASVTNVDRDPGTVSGSPHWIAPEILSGQEITQVCDIWSVGITLYELVEGKPPLADIPPINVISIIPERSAPTFTEPQKYSKNCNHFLSELCQKDPKMRKPGRKLLNHPFIKIEVEKALKGDHEVLKRLAMEKYPQIQEMRDLIAQETENYVGDVNAEDGEDEDSYYDYSDYDSEESDEEEQRTKSEIFAVSGPKAKPKPKNPVVPGWQKKKKTTMRKKRSAKSRATRNTRKSRNMRTRKISKQVGGRTLSPSISAKLHKTNQYAHLSLNQHELQREKNVVLERMKNNQAKTAQEQKTNQDAQKNMNEMLNTLGLLQKLRNQL